MPQVVIVGCDGKTIHDLETSLTAVAPTRDEVLVFDVSKPSQPQLLHRIAVGNSIWGPPTNLAFVPGGARALVADSMTNQENDGVWAAVPNDRLHLLSIAAPRAGVLATVQVGQQPSGVDVHPRGHLALVANRKSRNVSVVELHDHGLRLLGHVDVGGQASDVRFTPDGTRAVVTLFSEAAVAVLNIDGTRVALTHTVQAVPNPYPVVVAPSGRYALVASMGKDSATSDGLADPVGVIDLESSPPALTAHVLAGDSPESLAIDGTGRYAATVNLRGSSSRADAPAFHSNATVTLLDLRNGPGAMRVLDTQEVGAVAEGIAFGPDGRHLYVGNFKDRSLAVLRIEDDRLVQVSAGLPLGCQPASLE